MKAIGVVNNFGGYKIKRWIVILVVLLLFLGFSGSLFAYDFAVGGISAAGAAIGAYSGQLLAVPVLMMFSNIGLIKEDIFSPFSTAMYDAMDWGSGIGCVVGGITAKYAYLALVDRVWDWQSFAIDSLSASVIVLGTHLFFNSFGDSLGVSPFVSNVIIAPLLTGTYLGFIIPLG